MQSNEIEKQFESLQHQIKMLKNILATLLLVCGGVASLWFTQSLLGTAGAKGIPTIDPLVYSGYLEENGTPVNGKKNIVATLWDGTKQVCNTNNTSKPVDFVRGRFQMTLPTDCFAAVKQYPSLYIQIEVDKKILAKNKLNVVPYAINAFHAINATIADRATNADQATNANYATKSGSTGDAKTLNSYQMFTAHLDGNCTIKGKSRSWLSASSNGPTVCNIAFNSGIFTSAPICVCTSRHLSGIAHTVCQIGNVPTVSGMSIQTHAIAAAGIPTTDTFIMCMGK